MQSPERDTSNLINGMVVSGPERRFGCHEPVSHVADVSDAAGRLTHSHPTPIV